MTEDEILRVEIGKHRETPVITLSGDIDISNAKELRAALDSVGAQRTVAIDMSKLLFIDSTGLNAIAQYGRTLLDAGNELYLVVTRPPLRKIFEITSLDRHFTVCSSLEDLP